MKYYKYVGGGVIELDRAYVRSGDTHDYPEGFFSAETPFFQKNPDLLAAQAFLLVAWDGPGQPIEFSSDYRRPLDDLEREFRERLAKVQQDGVHYPPVEEAQPAAAPAPAPEGEVTNA